MASFFLTNDVFERILFFKGVPFLGSGTVPLEKREQIVPLFCVPFDEIGTCFHTTWEQNGPSLVKGEPIVPSSESRVEQIGP